MIEELDCRGLACPAPVLRAKERIENENPAVIRVRVDNEAGKQNVCRFLTSQGFEVSVEQEGDEFRIMGERDGTVQTPALLAEGLSCEMKRIMVMVSTDRMGHGDDGLGAKLMVNFLKTLHGIFSLRLRPRQVFPRRPVRRPVLRPVGPRLPHGLPLFCLSPSSCAL